MKTNLRILLGRKLIGKPCEGQGANSIRMVAYALMAAGIQTFNLTLKENADVLLKANRLNGDTVKITFASGNDVPWQHRRG